MLDVYSMMGILLAATIDMAIGFLWYSNWAFGKVWRKLTGMKAEDFEARKPEMPKIMGLTFAAALVTGYILTVFAQKMGMQGNPFAGLIMGFWAGIGLVLATHLPDYLYTKKPIELFWINAGYQAVAVMVMGGIVAWFA